MTITITNHPEKHRYEAAIEGQLAGYCEYNLLTNAVMFTHTEYMIAQFICETNLFH